MNGNVQKMAVEVGSGGGRDVVQEITKEVSYVSFGSGEGNSGGASWEDGPGGDGDGGGAAMENGRGGGEGGGAAKRMAF